jgi:1-acyl-sn-glycerol-3-phosphate acyltransferase
VSRMRPHYRVSRGICRLCFALLFRGRVFNPERVPVDGGVLLVSNHQSFLDPMVATLALPRECHFMARDTLFERPAFKRLIESFNAFPIKRGTADLRGIKEALRRLKNGGLVTAFPEGTRTLDGTIGPMLPGSIILARKAKVPIVPTVILGAYKAWPRHAKLPRIAPILVAYGAPLTVDQIAARDDETVIDVVRGRMLDLQQHYQHHPLLTGA